MDVLDYEAFRSYLRDWLEAHPRVSHRVIMRRLGSRDPALLSRVLAGKRSLPEHHLEALCGILELDNEGAEWFTALVLADRARTEAERLASTRRLAALETAHSARLIRDPESYRTWARVAVQELACCHGFVPDPELVAQRFDPPLSAEMARDALDHLPSGSPPPARATSERVRHREVFGYYRGIHHRTELALDRLERDPRAVETCMFLGVTMAVPEAQIPRLRRLLLDFQRDLMAGGAPDDTPDTVVQVNLQLFPLTRAADATPMGCERVEPTRQLR